MKTSFFSFYDSDNFASLKHAALYFETIVVPENAFPIWFRENNRFSRFVQLLPDSVRPHLELLTGEGIVEIQSLQAEPDDPLSLQSLFPLISDELAGTGTLYYTEEQLLPILRRLGVTREFEGALELARVLSVAITSFCLNSVVHNDASPVVDSSPIFDLVNAGLRGIARNVDSTEGGEHTINRLRAQALARELLRFRLPAFEFLSMADVLELRHRLHGRLVSFWSALATLGSSLDSLPGDEDFLPEIHCLIEQQIQPELDALEKDAATSWQGVATKVVGAGIAVSLQSLLPDLLGQIVGGYGFLSVREAIVEERARAKAARAEHPLGILLEVPHSCLQDSRLTNKDRFARSRDLIPWLDKPGRPRGCLALL